MDSNEKPNRKSPAEVDFRLEKSDSETSLQERDDDSDEIHENNSELTGQETTVTPAAIDFRLEKSDSETSLQDLADAQSGGADRTPSPEEREDDSDSLHEHQPSSSAAHISKENGLIDSDDGYHPLMCPVCLKTFQTNSGLRKHWKNAHAENNVKSRRRGESEKIFSCPHCPAKFAYKRNLTAHLNAFHSDGDQDPPASKRPRLRCERCQRDFTSKHSFQRHMHEQHPDQDPSQARGGGQRDQTTRKRPRSYCERCQREFTSKIEFQTHNREQHGDQNLEMEIQPDNADTKPKPRKARAKYTWRKSSEPVPTLPQPDPIAMPDRAQLRAQGYDDRLIDLLKSEFEHRWSYVRTNYRPRGSIVRSYNFRLRPPEPGANIGRMRVLVRRVHRLQTNQYKINIGFGFVTQPYPRDQVDEEMESNQQYLYPSEGNFLLFPTAPLVRDAADLEREVVENMTEDDIINFVSQKRESTKVRVTAITNMRLYIYPLHDQPMLLGGRKRSSKSIPEFVRKSKHILPLVINHNTNRPFVDKCCVFRAIATFESRQMQNPDCRNVESRVIEIRDLYCNAYQIPVASFEGVPISSLNNVEKLLSVRCGVYFAELGADKKIKLTPVRLPDNEQDLDTNVPAIPLCIWGRADDECHHVGLITDLQKLARSFACLKCRYTFDRSDSYQRHCARCRAEREGDAPTTPSASKYELYKSKLKPSGGGYKVPESLFHQLRKAGVVDIQASHQIKWNFCFYDYETYSTSLQHRVSVQQIYTHELIPLCVSVSARGIRDSALESNIFLERHRPDVLVKRMVDHMLKLSDVNYNQIRPDYEYIFTQLERLQSVPGIDEKLKKHYKTLSDRLEEWLRSFPCFGFNSSRFDIPLIRNILLPYLVQVDAAERGNEITVLKRGNAYLKVQSRRLVFLDIQHFLAPNFSYAEWLKAYEVADEKFVFPHTYLRKEGLDALLDRNTLPPIEIFNNDLSNQKLDPKIYQRIQDTWNEQKWTCMQDYLLYYAKLDTEPAREALTKMITFWSECIPQLPVNLSDSVSLPGLAIRFIGPILNSHTFIPLANRNTQEFYLKIRDQIVGGPSIIWTRFHRAGETKIRGHITDKEYAETCRGCFGLDANGLYLFCLGGDRFHHATGVPVRWKYNENTGKFTKKRMTAPGVSHQEIEWLIWEAKQCDQFGKLEHYYFGGQFRLPGRKFRFDGVCYETKTCYNFYGCYYHPHSGCTLIKSDRQRTTDIIKRKELERKEAEQWALTHGWIVKTINECEWKRLKEAEPRIVDYLSNHLLMDLPTNMTKEQLLEKINSDQWFGYVEADIGCEPGTDAWERCCEMSPIFRHAILDQSSGGPYMEAYSKKFNLKPAKTRMLIGAMNARRMIFASPVLKFLLQLGLKITRIYDCYQFVKKQLFREVAELVVNKRREADVDPSQKIKGDSMKLGGNSLFGKTIEQPLKKHNTRIVSNLKKLRRCVKDPRFVHLECLLSNANADREKAPFEVTVRPKKYQDKAPSIIGFTVLQYAKLVMLNFYYSFLDKYFPRKHWELILSDTDSQYIATSRSTWDEFENDCLRPELREDYRQNRNHYLPRTDTEANRRYDERTLGLFKLEWTGSSVLAVNSKTYYGYSISQKELEQQQERILNDLNLTPTERDDEIEKLLTNKEKTDKFVAKGVNKRQNPLNETDYEEVLKTGKARLVTNRGLRVAAMPVEMSIDADNNQKRRTGMVHYELTKVGLGFGYWKRVSDANLINTYPPPLDL